MKYAKPPLTLEQQADQLLRRGMAGDRDLMIARLRSVKPMIPLAATYPDWHRPAAVRNNRVFVVLTICRWCLERIAPQSGWGDRLRGLLDGASNIPLDAMGFPANWEQCPIWASAAPSTTSANVTQPAELSPTASRKEAGDAK